VTRLAAAQGAIVVLAAPAGLGKTALLEHAARRRPAGCRVRRAAPGPLERHFGFGVVRALLEGAAARGIRRAAGAPARRRGGPGRRPAARRRACPARDATMAIAHSVLWLCSALADEAPLMLVVDDAHWADRPSLEVLAYLARRIATCRLLIAIGARADDPDAAADLLSLHRRRARGDRAAPPAADAARRGAAHPPRGARHRVAVCRRVPSRGGRQPVGCTGELGRQIAEHGVSCALDASQGRRPAPPEARWRANGRARAPGRSVVRASAPGRQSAIA
jgi:hypothetical protein